MWSNLSLGKLRTFRYIFRDPTHYHNVKEMGTSQYKSIRIVRDWMVVSVKASFQKGFFNNATELFLSLLVGSVLVFK